WLLTIARNLLIDHQRRDRSSGAELIDERALPTQPGPESRFAGSPELAEALAQLNPREREVLALRFGGDLSGAEIAELTELTLTNVQQILSRSLRKLKALMDEQAGATETRL